MKNQVMKAILPFIAVLMLVISGCGGSAVKNVVPVEKSPYSDGAILPADPHEVPEYTIGIGDILKITVVQHPELSGSVKVGSYGEIRLPESKDIIIALHKTVAEVEKEVISVVSKYLKSEPVVALEVETFNSKFVYVLGAVKNPGQFALKDSALTLRDAVFLAGMPANDAELRKLVVVNPAFEKPLATGINFQEIMYGGRMKYNIILHEGDIVFIPFTTFSKTVDAISRVASPLGNAATGLASALFIGEELRNND